MVLSPKRAFVLPYALLLGSALLALAILFLQMGSDQVKRAEAESLQSLAVHNLRLNVAPLVRDLDRSLSAREGASAWIPTDTVGVYSQVLLASSSGKQIAISSFSQDPAEQVAFNSPCSDAAISAQYISLSPEDQGRQVQLAWAFEDLAIFPDDTKAPPMFWPLSDWYWSPSSTGPPISQYLDKKTHGQWLAGPWIPKEESLPFTMDASPALVPVVESLSLRLGIFASGPVRSREKVIRARFYFEGILWNPYNRLLQVHNGSGLRPTFQLAFINLPEVRIHNLDRGVSTAWIPLDDAKNDYSGAGGFHGWMRMPPAIQPGERIRLLEPDPSWQPEGLARTLHPAFPVGPADHIQIEFREPAGGLYITCQPLGLTDPVAAALGGAGWFRIEGFPVLPDPLDFKRADEGDQPFYLAGGSLSFRKDNTHLDFSFSWKPSHINGLTETRHRILNQSEGQWVSNGNWIPNTELIDVSAYHLTGPGDSILPELEARTPLFSWPEQEPASMIEASDLPQWQNGFRIGSPHASALNKLLDHYWMWAIPEYSTIRVNTGMTATAYRRSFPVNLLSDAIWAAILKGNASGQTTFSYPAYPWTNPDNSADFLYWQEAELRGMASRLADRNLQQPLASVSDFFNQGRLVDCIPLSVSANPLQQLSSLRGFLRNGPMPRSHGSAWLLHLAIQAKTAGLSIRRSATVWLLETGANEDTEFKIIQFQWTDPDIHLRNLP